MEKKKLTKQDIKQIQALQYCYEVFDRMEENKKTDRYRHLAKPLTEVVIENEEDYKLFSTLLALDCLTPEENEVVTSALEAYKKNGMSVPVTEEEYELIDRALTNESLNKLDKMFKGKSKKK